MVKYEFFFDYVYYRVCRFYLERDGKNGFTASLVVSLSQLLIGHIIVILFFHLCLSQKLFSYLFITYKPVYYIILFAVIIFNSFAYRNKYDLYDEHWGDESERKQIWGGVYVIGSVVLWFGLLILLINWAVGKI